jgi:hypothetical protein
MPPPAPPPLPLFLPLPSPSPLPSPLPLPLPIPPPPPVHSGGRWWTAAAMVMSNDLGNDSASQRQTTVGNDLGDDMSNDVGNGDDGADNAGNNASKGDGRDAGGEGWGGFSSEVKNKMIFMGHQISSCHVPVVRSFSSTSRSYHHLEIVDMINLLPKYFNITLKLPNMTFDKSKKNLVMSCFQLFLPLKVTLFCTISRLVLTKYHTLLSQQVNFSCPNNNIFKLIP